MIDTSAEGLLREVQAAEEQTQRYQANVADMVYRYHGPWYCGTTSVAATSVDGISFTENHYYEWATLMVPRLAFYSPKVHVKSRRGGSQQETVRAIRHAVNRWAADVNLFELQERLVMDLQFSYAVALTTLVRHPGDAEAENPRMWPHMARIPPENFFWDVWARSVPECQMLGHQWIVGKQELLERARQDKDLPEDLQEGWDLAAVQRLVESQGVETARKGLKDRNTPYVDRNEVVLRDVWVPGESHEDGDERHSGTIFTISDVAEFPAKPRPYYGPRWGPYTVFGIHAVPNHVVPMSPMTAVEDQIRELNEHAKAMSRSARKYKRFVAVSEKTPKLRQQIAASKHDFVYSVDTEKLSDGLAQIELAGITQQQVVYHQMMREKLDRVSGITDAQRGNVTGVGTATEVSAAVESSNIRTDFIVNKFVGQLGRALSTVAWFMYHTQEVVFPLGEEASQEMGMIEPWFFGGSYEEGSGATFDDLELEIEPYSVARMSEQRRLLMMQEMDSMIMTIAPAMLQLPHVNWSRYLQMRGEVLGIPDLDKLIDPQMAAQLAGMQMAAQAAPQAELEMNRGTYGFAPKPPAGKPAPQGTGGVGGFGRRGVGTGRTPQVPSSSGVKMIGSNGKGGGGAVSLPGK